MADSITTDQLRQIIAENPYGYFRYVRVGYEFRFADIASSNLTHRTLRGDDVATGAGFIRTHCDWMLVEGNSMTLSMGPSRDDEEVLSKLLRLPIKDSGR